MISIAAVITIATTSAARWKRSPTCPAPAMKPLPRKRDRRWLRSSTPAHTDPARGGLAVVGATAKIAAMDKVITCVALLVCFAASALAADNTRPPGYVIPNSEVRTLPVNAAGRHYSLFVLLPASYAREPTKRYPVVFVTDGYWD